MTNRRQSHSSSARRTRLGHPARRAGRALGLYNGRAMADRRGRLLTTAGVNNACGGNTVTVVSGPARPRQSWWRPFLAARSGRFIALYKMEMELTRECVEEKEEKALKKWVREMGGEEG